MITMKNFKQTRLVLCLLALLGSSSLYAGSKIGGSVNTNVSIRNSDIVLIGGVSVSSSGVKVDAEAVFGTSIRNSEVGGSVTTNVEIRNSDIVAIGTGRLIIGTSID
jgi:hypothetical protein